MKAGGLSGEAVRYGSAERIEGSTLEPIWHRSLLQTIQPGRNGQAVGDPGIERWAEVLSTREGREAAAKWLLGPRHIHAATCVGMARRDYGLSARIFDIAVVDEAGKAFGAELLLPAAVARRLVLVGDHNQLPPTVTTDVLDESIGYRLSLDEVEELLRRNMFHEIFEQLPANKKGMLTLQYRMHEDIGDLVSDLFYDGNLKSHRTGGDWSLTRKRVVFVDFTRVRSYRNQRSRNSESQENRTERAALHAVLHRLSARNRGAVQSVLVICPYKAQRFAVEQEIREESYSFRVEASTVDAVQGGEADMVILLMTRSHGRVQFLLDRHRLNVALSRAREAVVILGHAECLAPSGDGPIGRMIELGRQRGSLELVQLQPKADFKRELAPAVVP
jgi:superfamily I DNA and/or RNA helicase